MAKKGERHTGRGDQKSNRRDNGLFLKNINFTKDMSKRCQCLARIPEEEFEEKINV